MKSPLMPDDGMFQCELCGAEHWWSNKERWHIVQIDGVTYQACSSCKVKDDEKRKDEDERTVCKAVDVH